jgi:hypothetical protein
VIEQQVVNHQVRPAENQTQSEDLQSRCTSAAAWRWAKIVVRHLARAGCAETWRLHDILEREAGAESKGANRYRRLRPDDQTGFNQLSNESDEMTAAMSRTRYTMREHQLCHSTSSQWHCGCGFGKMGFISVSVK